MPATVLILGGTGEGAELAATLAARDGVRVISSLAGATRSPSPVAGEVRIGGFGGPDGLARTIVEERVDAVVDATHPFATRISRSAARACAGTTVPIVHLVRPAWEPGGGDRWHSVVDLDSAARALPALGRRAFLSIGLRDLDPFAAPGGAWYLLRAVDPPVGPIALEAYALVLGRGPFRVEEEMALLDAHRIDVLVTRNAGGEGSRAKLLAARRLGIPVLMVSRPSPPPGERVTGVPGVLAWLERAARIPDSGDARPQR